MKYNELKEQLYLYEKRLLEAKKERDSLRNKKKLYKLLSISPYILYGGLLFAEYSLIKTEKQYNYTIETNYDSEDDFDTKLLEEHGELKDNTITIYDEYVKTDDTYTSHFRVYDASDLSIEKIKKVSDIDDYCVSYLLGDYITGGIVEKKEITEEDQHKKVIATIYTKSDKEYVGKKSDDELSAQNSIIIIFDFLLFLGTFVASTVILDKSDKYDSDYDCGVFTYERKIERLKEKIKN